MLINDAVRRSIELDIEATQVYSQVEQRPWGLLFLNAANPHHYDSNSARRIRADDPAVAISELVNFYRAQQLTPRVKIDDMTLPHDFAARLEAHGFQSDSTVMRVMVWDGGTAQCEPLLPHITISRAIVADLNDFVRVQADGFGADQTDWIAGALRYQLGHPRMRCYLVRVDGLAVAGACVFDGSGWGAVANVATVPAYRRRGLATALMKHIQAESTTPLLLEVVEDDAQRIYERVGFRVQGKLHQTSCWLLS